MDDTSPEKRGYALYDLDHTILPFDTQVLFCNYVLQQKGEWWRRGYVFLFIPLIPLAVLKVLDLRIMKRVFSSYLWGMPEATVKRYAADFAENVVPKVSYPEVLTTIEENKKAGRLMVLNSASPEFYVEAIANVLGFDHFVGTGLVLEDPMPLIPQIVGPNNKKAEKITAMHDRGILPKEFDETRGDQLPDSHGYSDSSVDVPLLSICKRGTMIHPSENFAAHGKEPGWTTLHPAQPYSGKWGGRFASVLQAFGLWKI